MNSTFVFWWIFWAMQSWPTPKLEFMKNIMIIKKRQCLLVFQNYPTKMAGIIFLWFFLYSSAFDFESPLWVWADVQLGPFDFSVGALLKDELFWSGFFLDQYPTSNEKKMVTEESQRQDKAVQRATLLPCTERKSYLYLPSLSEPSSESS